MEAETDQEKLSATHTQTQTSLSPDEVHDLVLSFTGDAGIGQEHLQAGDAEGRS